MKKTKIGKVLDMKGYENVLLIHRNNFSGFVTQDMKERLNHQKLDANHSLILLSTILMFCMFHSPRVIISIYEAVTIKSLLTCMERQKGFYTIWYLYIQRSLQFVQVINSRFVFGFLVMCLGKGTKKKPGLFSDIDQKGG